MLNFNTLGICFNILSRQVIITLCAELEVTVAILIY